MQKLTIILAGFLGILLGLWYFVTRSMPRVHRCKQARGLSRHILLTGILVSAAASYMVGCASKPTSAEKARSGATAQNNGHGDRLDALVETQEWRELSAIWNLLTGDQRVLEDEKDRELLTYSLNKQLYGLVVRLRLNKLRELSLLSETEQAALENLFATMSSHYFSKRSGMTCYLMTGEGARLVEGRDSIEQQTQLLRKHYRQGTLSKDVVAKIETTIAAKLRLLNILNEEDAGLLTAKEISTRAAEWFEQGKIGSITPDRWQKEQLIKAILADKDSTISDEDRQFRAQRWSDHKSRLTKTVVALGRYTPDANAEKDVLAALRGRSVPLKNLTTYLRDVENSGRERLLRLYVERAGRKAIPLLKELLRDEEIRVSGEGNGCIMSFPVRTAAARQLAMMGISTPGYEDILGPPPEELPAEKEAMPTDGLTAREKIVQELLAEPFRDPYHGDAKTYNANTPEAKAILKQLLRSRSVKVVESAIWPAGLSRDPAMIPLLEKIAAKHTELHDEIARALEDIGHPDGLPLLFEMVERGTTASCYVFPAVVAIGGDEAVEFCEKLLFESPSTNTQTDAVAYLVQMQKEKAVPILLKVLEQKKRPFLRIYAARYLQRLGNDVALPIAMELVKSQDKRVQNVAFDILASADDEVSGQLLCRFVDDQTYARRAVISLMRRGGKLAASTLRKVMASESEDLQDAALSRCAYVEFPGIESILLEASKRPSDKVRRRAIQALCNHATEKSATVLREMLTTTPELREDIRSTLRGIAERHCRRRCDDIMKREGGGKPENLSTDDMFALLVLKLHDQYGPDADRRQEFAKGVVNTPGIPLAPAIVRYFSDYDHEMYDSQFMSSECEELMRILDKRPKEAARAVLAFVQNGQARNRELGLGFFGGRGYGRDPYPLEEISGLGDILEECLRDRDPRVAAEAKRLKAIAAAKSRDRTFTAAFYDLQTPKDRAAALTALRYPQWGRVTFTQEQKELLVPAIAGIVREIARNPGRERQPWSAVEIATKLGDRRLLPALSALVLSYDPDSTSEYAARHVREVVEALTKQGIGVTRKADGRYAVQE